MNLKKVALVKEILNHVFFYLVHLRLQIHL